MRRMERLVLTTSSARRFRMKNTRFSSELNAVSLALPSTGRRAHSCAAAEHVDTHQSSASGARSQRGLTTSRKSSSRLSTRDIGRDSDRTTVKLWSVLEENEGIRRLARDDGTSSNVVSVGDAGGAESEAAIGTEPTHSSKTLQLIEALRSSSSITALDKRWRAFTTTSSLFESDAVDRKQVLVARSLAISRIASGASIVEMNRVLGAMNRILKNPSQKQAVSKEEYLKVVNQASTAFIRAGKGEKALEIIQELRKEQGPQFPNRASYALAIAGVLLPSKPAKIERKPQTTKDESASASEKVLDKNKESAFKSALVYFKSFFASQKTLDVTAAGTSGQETSQISEEEREVGIQEQKKAKKPTIFSVLTMLKEDYAAGNSDASLTQELFDDLLIIAPKMSAEVAEVMARSGFQPTPTTFLAMLHSAMKAGDAQKALQLLNAMMEQDIPRDHIHYIAVASALAARAALDKRRVRPATVIKPWYFKALLDSYVKDFGAVDDELAGILIKGMCRTKSGDQDLIPMLEGVVKDLANQKLVLDSESYAALIDRLSVTNGRDNVKRIADWMHTCGVERDCVVNEAFLKFYGEHLVKLHRGVTRLLLDTTRPESKALAEAKIRESTDTVAKAEQLVSEILASRSNYSNSPVYHSLRQQQTTTPASNVKGVLDVTQILPSFKDEGEDDRRLGPDSRPFLLLARTYAYSFNSGKLQQLIDLFAAEIKSSATANIKESLKPLIHELIKAHGLEGKVDQAVEVVSRMQSEAIPLDSETVDLLAVDVFVRNGRLSEGLAHLLGLCRTYKITPRPSTALRLLEKAKKDNDKEEEEQVLAMFDEFGLENELKRVRRNLQ